MAPQKENNIPQLNEDDIKYLIEHQVIKTVKELTDETRALNEMATIGKFTNNLVIMVRMNDGGNIPHFHVLDENSLGGEFETCIRFDSNRYFHHHGKEGVLNSKQRKKLVEFLKQELIGGWTNWSYMIDAWNRNNSSIQLSKDLEMPDYTIITE